MGKNKEMIGNLSLNQAAKEIGIALGKTPKLRELIEIESPFGILTRIKGRRIDSDTPLRYQPKKHLLSGLIENQPAVILFFSGEVYGQDETYFRRIYQNCRDVFSGQATQFSKRKITPALLGFDDGTMTLIIEEALHDLSYYYSSVNSNEVRTVIQGAINLMEDVWQKSLQKENQLPRYLTAFLQPEYPFLADKKVEDYLRDPKVIHFYQESQRVLRKAVNQLPSFKSGFGFSDVKPDNLVEDREGNILFIDVGKPGFLHWLSMLGQFYQATIEKAPHTLFIQELKKEIGKVFRKHPQPELAVKLFTLGRMNRYLIGCTLRNIVFTAETSGRVDENRIRDFLAKVRHLSEIESPKEALGYASDQFDSDWRERLKNYPQTQEFPKNLERLKVEIDQKLTSEKPTKKLVFVLMGIGGSGKSTLAQLIAESLHPSVVLRSDWIFFKKLRDQIEADYYKAYAYQEELARQYLQEGYSIVMDDNNRTAKNRRGVYQWAKTLGAEPILIIIDVKPEISAKRVTIKGGEAWTEEEMLEGLKASYLSLEPPSSEERKQVKIIKIDGNQSPEKIKAQLEKAL